MGNPGKKQKQTHNMKRQVSKGKPWKRGKKTSLLMPSSSSIICSCYFFNQGANPKQGQNSFEPLIA
jgi:hypothetical protein